MKRIQDSDRKITLACILTDAALSWLPGAAAQGLVLEEVIVTAQKRTESLQDVPISVAAMSGEKIDDIGITSLRSRR
jgi:outer membrane receptor protein involved in Fe transport